MGNRILEIKDEAGLKRLDPQTVDIDDFTDETLDHIFRLCNGLWMHSGNPKEPHVEISGGLCSDGFVNLRYVLRHPNLCEILAKISVERLRNRPEFASMHVDWVFGSDHTSAVFAYEVAKLLGAKFDFTERGPNKTQLWRRGVIEPHEIVLQAEALIATGRTAKATRLALRQGNHHSINFFPAVLAVVNRSNADLIDHIYPIVSMRRYNMKTWARSQCPLHEKGSHTIREPQYSWPVLTGAL
jgi:orotate phosphoribosyltransferase